MISWMQKHRKYLVVTIWISTIAFIGAGFVGWGMYDYNLDRASSVAKVGNEKITVKEFQHAYSNLYNYYNQTLFRGTLTKKKAEEMKLEELTLNKLIVEALLINYAKDLGMGVLDSEVQEKLKSIKAFQKDGVFNIDRYFQVLKSIGQQPVDFENGLKKEILLDKLKRIISPKATQVEKEAFASAFFLQDRIELKLLNEENTPIKLDENETKSYWEKNKNRYLTKTNYVVEAVRIGIEDVNATDKEIREFYKSEKFRYKDEKGKILPFEKAKDRVEKDLKLKKAKKIALKKYLLLKKGKIKADQKITLTEGKDDFPFEKLKNAKKGEILKPIKEKNGYLVIKLDIINLPKPMKYEEAKELVKSDLTKEKKIELLKEKAAKIIKNFKGTDIGFVSRNDYEKLTDMNLTKKEAIEFLDKVFSNNVKIGFFVFGSKAILYKITEQKLFDENKLKENEGLLVKNIIGIKESTIENSLIRKLQKKYKIEKFYRQQ